MKRLVIFSGAGMSAESGISTFRDSNGLWENYKIEEVASPKAWEENPKMVQNFYNIRRRNILQAEPNDAHLLVAKLDQYFETTVITQNIDDLHERAGSKNVLHLHGNIMLAKSSSPQKEQKYYPISGDLDIENDFCDDGYPLRPHVVWFGEDVPNYPIALEIIKEADYLIVIGTSLVVYPAAGLIHYAKNSCENFIIDPNLEDSMIPNNFQFYKMKASEGMEILMKILIKELITK